MDWLERLHREALPSHAVEYDLLTHVAVRPAVPPEYVVPHLVAVTFRLSPRPQGGFLYATSIDVAAALRVGRRFGLDEAGSLAMVDSHERVHIWLQLADVDEDAEERCSRVVDAAWLALRSDRAARLMDSGGGGMLVKVGHDFLEQLIDVADEGET